MHLYNIIRLYILQLDLKNIINFRTENFKSFTLTFFSNVLYICTCAINSNCFVTITCIAFYLVLRIVINDLYLRYIIIIHERVDAYANIDTNGIHAP